ncbi:MAG TPA: ferredoxin reductase [Mycobacteriales bacterium]|nr:ferredoxin reductase [Mycobacteriales bacterium]
MSVIERPATAPGSLRSRLARLGGLVTTPLVASDYLDLFDPLRSPTDLRGRILEIQPETADAATLVIKPGRSWRGHVPGQYVRIGVDIDGIRRWRAYSVTSPTDRADGCITVTVKAIPDGIVSNFLVRRAKPGLVVQLDQATGDFTLPAQPPARLLFVTGGSGITPVMGMLRSFLAPAGDAIDALDDVVLLHSALTPEDVIFGEELRGYAAAGQLRLIERHSDLDGLLTADDIVALVGDIADRETFVCGPAGLLELLESHWEATGRTDLLHTERFRPAIAAIGDGGTVTFTSSDVTVAADGSSPLLDVGEAAGVLMPSGCRMGICFGCVRPLREGAVRDLRTGDLTEASEGDGVLIQTCVSAAAGPCSIDI